ncbi:type II toxin-antitoxin system RelE/ParE family toxin [Blastomonas sp. SL216]|uniref:type II toxin-antitoxin system RelE/ParE family toxin n=1 Tax=Blastomonas sp. SL216 TaxID=2995169 RepID=UPI0023776B9D|nr:type II toxin-antitoxin system RelE/ParE family toxin [Blastomonas sp. SL216]
MRVTWSARAQDDFTIIFRQALDEDARYARNLVDALSKAMDRLSDYPRLGTPVGSDGHRKWRLPGTPFLIVYHAGEESLHILRVYHERQDWSTEP